MLLKMHTNEETNTKYKLNTIMKVDIFRCVFPLLEVCMHCFLDNSIPRLKSSVANSLFIPYIKLCSLV